MPRAQWGVAALLLGTVGTAGLAAAHAQQPTSATSSPLMVPVKRKPSDATWKPYPARTLDNLPGFSPAKEPPLDRYGGRTDRKGANATGFFHTEKTDSGRWWLVDPDGNLFENVGMVSVDPHKSDAYKAKFATTLDWEKWSVHLLKGNGFNGVGCWSDVKDLRAEGATPLVYTVMGNSDLPGTDYGGGMMQSFGKKIKDTHSGTGHVDYIGDCIPVFHPDFPAYCDAYCKPIAARKNDPYLLGYFSDNEMPLPTLTKYLALPPDDPRTRDSYQAARDWWDARKGVKNASVTDIKPDDQEAWAEYALDRYYQITTGAIRKYDPNHLCLGPRINYGARAPGAYRAAGKYLDVVAINLYFVWDPQKAVTQISQWAEGKPVVITEWYAKGMDSGFANTAGAGWTVPTQKDRGLFYQTFTLGLLQSKVCVGWHWFKFMDNDPNDKHAEASNTDSNKGIVTNDYTTYPPLLDQMKRVNDSVYAVADYFDAGGGKQAAARYTSRP